LFVSRRLVPDKRCGYRTRGVFDSEIRRLKSGFLGKPLPSSVAELLSHSSETIAEFLKLIWRLLCRMVSWLVYETQSLFFFRSELMARFPSPL
jgi:hypothetical protein